MARTRRRTAPRSGDKFENVGGDQGSIIWTILLIGLVFCLGDVAYILQYVDQQQQGGGGGGGSTDPREHNHIPHPNHDGGEPMALRKRGGGAVFYEEGDNSDQDSHMRYDEARMMERQLHRHEMQIYGGKPPASPRENKHIEPLTEEEERTILREKKEILDMLRDAKVDVGSLDPQVLRDLPTWKEVVELYGPEPRIYGLDQCEMFQKHSDPWEHFVSTAGTFNRCVAWLRSPYKLSYVLRHQDARKASCTDNKKPIRY